ncbi:hypothetical protein PR1_72 [Providencia phage vB_PreS_PR1]|uniref:Uncharacterized protein n=1 Tax=Providencia phage vB_PreS_PR1 TaxID=1931407 RepID=A0A1S6KV61_9CAUD|nr:hypothetical protein FDH30_gp143 [Providencia phage vB_PreS_PR1]AQT25312.1 hypothetical protein PR1_72 [Providencia phage vB_PreS_PR1]
MQKYLASDYILLKYPVSKVYTTKKGIDFVYLEDNQTITLQELDELGESYTLFSSLAKTRDQAEQEFNRSIKLPKMPEFPKERIVPDFQINSLWDEIKTLFKKLFKRA